MTFERLGKNTEFKRVYRKGRSRANRYLVMVVLAGQGGSSRFGFSVSKKVGNSVIRHHVTRYLREAVRALNANITEGNRIVIIARPAVTDLNFHEVTKSVEKLCRAHHIWRMG